MQEYRTDPSSRSVSGHNAPKAASYPSTIPLKAMSEMPTSYNATSLTHDGRFENDRAGEQQSLKSGRPGVPIASISACIRRYESVSSHVHHVFVLQRIVVRHPLDEFKGIAQLLTSSIFLAFCESAECSRFLLVSPWRRTKTARESSTLTDRLSGEFHICKPLVHIRKLLFDPRILDLTDFILARTE